MNYNEIVLEALRSMGFELSLVGDAGYVFSYEDINFLLMPDDDDTSFLRIAVPHMFDVTEGNKAAVLETVHDTGLIMKYAKLNIMFETSVWAIYEHYMVSGENVEDLLEHIIRVLYAATEIFLRKINGEDFESPRDRDEDNEVEDSTEAELDKILETLDEND